MAFTLLFISSVPLVPNAIAGSPKHMHEKMHHDMSDIATQTTADHEMSEDMQHCRIECACGCHKNIDTLPHLLAPHALSVQQDKHIQAVSEYITYMETIQTLFRLRIPLPPPELV